MDIGIVNTVAVCTYLGQYCLPQRQPDSQPAIKLQFPQSGEGLQTLLGQIGYTSILFISQLILHLRGTLVLETIPAIKGRKPDLPWTRRWHITGTV